MELIITTLCEDDDYYRSGVHTSKIGDQEVLEILHSNGFSDESGDNIPELDVLRELLFELDWVCNVETLEEYERAQAEKDRKRLESTAATLATQHGLQVNSLEFLELLDRMINQQESYREGMREDGLCIGYGVTPEQWCDEHNASVSDTMGVRELKEWMLDNLPLLCAQYCEQQLALA